MSKTNDHIIHQLKWDITTDSFNDATGIQQQVSNISSQLAKRIEQVFDRVCSPNQWMQIDRLEIDLGEINSVHLNNDFEKVLAEKLGHNLLESLDHELSIQNGSPTKTNGFLTKKDDSIRSEATLPREDVKYREFELIMHFLEYGTLPWWYSTDLVFQFNEVFEKVIAKLNSSQKINLSSLLEKPKVRKRTWFQLSESNKLTLLKNILAEYRLENFLSGSSQEIDQAKSGDDQEVEKSLLIVLFSRLIQSFLEEKLGNTVLLEPAKRIIWNALVKESVPKSASNQAAVLQNVLQNFFLDLQEEISKKEHQLSFSFIQSYSVFTDSFSAFVKATSTISYLQDIPEAKTISFTALQKLSSVIAKAIGSGPTNVTQTKEEMKGSKTINKEVNAEVKNQDTTPSENTVIPCLNAGLVLLWPYLGGFFKKLKLVKGKAFNSVEDQQKAVYLLHFLATEKEEAEEHELTVNKLLCGLAADFPIESAMPLDDNEKAECIELLKSVIANWKVLKGTSVATLRKTFLQRPGFMEYRNNQYVIKIERTTIDILINQMSYGLETIVLPWRKDFLRCEW